MFFAVICCFSFVMNSKKISMKGGSSEREECRKREVDPMLKTLMKMMEEQDILIRILT